MKCEKIIIISGASVTNIGAEAMLLEALRQIRQTFLEHRIVILSDSMFRIDMKDKINMKYEILPENLLCVGRIDAFARFMLKRQLVKLADYKILARLEQAEYWFDINGFKLGQQWGMEAMLRYLFRIHTAKTHSIKMCLLPQSFGPFDKLRGIHNLPFHLLMRKELRYPALIMAREEEGERALKRYTKKNVVFFQDMVISSRSGADASLLYQRIPEEKVYFVQEGAVALVPNEKTAKYGVGMEKATQIYQDVIDTVRHQGRIVWIIPHCAEDIPICQAVKRVYEEDDKVVLINDKLSVCEYRKLIKKFSYVVISRFHGGVHALKENIPCIFIGWAVKYQALAKKIGLEEFVIDVNSWGNGEVFKTAIQKMEREKNVLQTVIKDRVQKIEGTYNLRETLQMYL